MNSLQSTFKFPISYDVPVVRIQMVRESILRLERDTIDDCRSALGVARQFLELADREQFIMMALDSKNNITALNHVSTGTINMALVAPREVFKAAILANASGIIVAHNHPSGDPTPSEEDFRLTEVLVKLGNMLDIPVLDHLIIGDNGRFTSLHDKGFC